MKAEKYKDLYTMSLMKMSQYTQFFPCRSVAWLFEKCNSTQISSPSLSHISNNFIIKMFFRVVLWLRYKFCKLSNINQGRTGFSVKKKLESFFCVLIKTYNLYTIQMQYLLNHQRIEEHLRNALI